LERLVTDFRTDALSDLFANTVLYHLEPVASLLSDPEVSEVMINGPNEIYAERSGFVEFVDDLWFEDEDALMAACINIAQYSGKVLDERNPRMDARLPDGSRVHVVIPPIATVITVAIRKFARRELSMADLIAFGSIDEAAANLLKVAIQMKRNLVVSGGTGSGKTTMLNVLAHYFDDHERIVVLEDTRELKLPKPHLVQLEARAPDENNRYEVSIRDLLHSALRLRPDRILVGEVRGGEALDLLNALNSGHGGTMSTLHANTPLGALAKLETLVLFAGEDLPARAVRSQICNAVDIIVQVNRFKDGSRRVDQIAEVLPTLDDHGNYQMNVLYRFKVYRIEEAEAHKRIVGALEPTGNLPSFFEEAAARGYPLYKADFVLDDEETARH
jgi:pilus assembly protein CpaF